MSIKAVVAQGAVVAVPAANTITDNGIITALDLENYVMFGMTFGAIFKVLMMLSIFLIILINLNKLYKEAKKAFRSFKILFSEKKDGKAKQERV